MGVLKSMIFNLILLSVWFPGCQIDKLGVTGEILYETLITSSCLSKELLPLGSPQWLGIWVHGYESHLPLDFTDSFCKQRNCDSQEAWIPSCFKLWSAFVPVFSFQSWALLYFRFSSWISLSQIFLASNPLLPPSPLCIVPALHPYMEISSNSVSVSL